jgi:hypothetical protein
MPAYMAVIAAFGRSQGISKERQDRHDELQGPGFRVQGTAQKKKNTPSVDSLGTAYSISPYNTLRQTARPQPPQSPRAGERSCGEGEYFTLTTAQPER